VTVKTVFCRCRQRQRKRREHEEGFDGIHMRASPDVAFGLSEPSLFGLGQGLESQRMGSRIGPMYLAVHADTGGYVPVPMRRCRTMPDWRSHNGGRRTHHTGCDENRYSLDHGHIPAAVRSNGAVDLSEM
jgi:hypothetical protein